ncbi:MAG: GntR family transcriptional regulator [Ferrovum sp. 37-45-19]|uniref:GntR family transcriptional regulator n=1 Tax=Ferrovum sp. JA12 TaxID=1356299 RepID=UPI000703AA84|nr:GntR family transcriptional regulator [Ferrovum sp. JA12]OYV80279.1 MAG: GntR family transcriptional regulator [Ferrovum sp. 21-44-67]OYV95025.1 MAG: GntR family transcriptional regulator [Ferrovum sp. 37-45-19]OZB32218.1 MAG: GntR family transcriptional regulator [Ferrovum sp. 34-44-207]HQT80919.1 GntR family transcriptional regulator [Ferrovaceae bacterium]KRH78761.1 putative HTH-type transcriptional regulator YurK [Ferrovum sp. JA12]
MNSLMSPSYRPLYDQIKILITQSLIAGEWKPGDSIPSEIDLANRYKVSQGTVRKAIDELAAENILIRRQGKGTYVASHTTEISSTRFLRINRDDGKVEYPISQFLSVTREKAPEVSANLLELRVGAGIYCIKRILSYKNKAQIFDEIHIPVNYFKGLDESMVKSFSGSLYSFFETRFGITMIRAEEHIKAVAATSEVAKLLMVPERQPLLQVDRVAFTYGDRPVEWRRGLCNTDKFSYVTEMS